MSDPGDKPLKDLDLEDKNNENAIDDTVDLNNEETQHHQIVSEGRRRQSRPDYSRIQQLLPVPFLPNFRPLTISDLESCVALENASFSNPGHRCTREKVSFSIVQSCRCLDLIMVYGQSS